MKLKWLGRNTVVTPYLTLCTTKEHFLKACKQLKQDFPLDWLRHCDGARCHTFTKDNKITCIVCIDIEEALKYDEVIVIGMLVHEATHVCQQMMENIGEHSPSSEFQAYSMQNITQELLWEYRRQRDEYNRNKKAHA